MRDVGEGLTFERTAGLGLGLAPGGYCGTQTAGLWVHLKRLASCPFEQRLVPKKHIFNKAYLQTEVICFPPTRWPQRPTPILTADTCMCPRENALHAGRGLTPRPNENAPKHHKIAAPRR